MVTVSSQEESMSGSDSTSEVSDYMPDKCSGSDEDFEPSPLPAKPTKKLTKQTKQSGKAKSSTKTKQPAKKTAGVVSRPASKNKKNVSNACKAPEAVDSACLPGSMRTSRPSPVPPVTKVAAESVPGKVTRGPRTKWVPPSKVDSGNTITSSSPQGRLSGAPVIRVGLSRKAPIKPLHQTPLRTKN